VADYKDIFRWFNTLLLKAGNKKWKINSTKWEYVQLKYNIPNTEDKVWIPAKLGQ